MSGIRRTLFFAACALVTGALCSSAAAARYVVLYNKQAVPADARSGIAAASGKVVASYPQIGVLIASSTSTSFRTKLLGDGRIAGVVSTAGFGSRLTDRTRAERRCSHPAGRHRVHG